jgi:hypothetical protein
LLCYYCRFCLEFSPHCHMVVLSLASCVNSNSVVLLPQLLHGTPPTGTGPATALDGLPEFWPIPWDRNRAFLIQTVYMWWQPNGNRNCVRNDGPSIEALNTSAEVRTRGDAGSVQARGKRARLSRGVALLSARGVWRGGGFSDRRGMKRKESKDSRITFQGSAQRAFIATY